ncbi:MAG: TRAP transporter substrate-binding protein [Cyclobacteriaceae bacterium]
MDKLSLKKLNSMFPSFIRKRVFSTPYSLSIVLFTYCILFFSSCNQNSNVRHIHLAHTLDQTHPVHKAMLLFSEQLKEKSSGRIEVDIYPSQQLGSERECLELLQIGSLGITKVSAAVLENFSKDFKVFSLPYIFKSKEHRVNALKGEIGSELLNGLTTSKLKGLCYYDAGSRSFYTKDKPVNGPEDIKGLKVRVMKSQNAIDMVSAFGGMAAPISFGELYTALQQGVVDAAENNPPSFVTSKHYEICKYYSINEHASIPDVMVMSETVWRIFSEQEKQWIMEAANASSTYQYKLWEESENECLALLKKEGVEITYPDKALFSEKVEELKAVYKKDERMNTIIEQIQSVE